MNLLENRTVIGWTSTNICSEIFELQGFTIRNGQISASPAHVTSVGSLNTGVIPINQSSSSSGDEIYYRLVAVNENGAVCSDETSQDTYYRFEGMM